MYTSIKYVSKAHTDWKESKTIKLLNKGYGNTIQPLSASLISRSVVWYVSMITPWRLKNLFKDLRSRVDLKPCWFRHEGSRQSPSTKSTFDVQNLAIPHQLRYVNTIGRLRQREFLSFRACQEIHESSRKYQILLNHWRQSENENKTVSLTFWHVALWRERNVIDWNVSVVRQSSHGFKNNLAEEGLIKLELKTANHE